MSILTGNPGKNKRAQRLGLSLRCSCWTRGWPRRRDGHDCRVRPRLAVTDWWCRLRPAWRGPQHSPVLWNRRVRVAPTCTRRGLPALQFGCLPNSARSCSVPNGHRCVICDAALYRFRVRVSLVPCSKIYSNTAQLAQLHGGVHPLTSTLPTPHLLACLPPTPVPLPVPTLPSGPPVP